MTADIVSGFLGSASGEYAKGLEPISKGPYLAYSQGAIALGGGLLGTALSNRWDNLEVQEAYSGVTGYFGGMVGAQPWDDVLNYASTFCGGWI